MDEAGAARKPRKTSERRAQSRALVLPETMTVQYLAEVMNQNPIDVIKQLMRNGIMASMNQVIDYKVATLVSTALGIRTSIAEAPTAAKGPAAKTTTTEDDADLVTRPPVITVLGHVDHGKTSLLDSIRNSKVADGEVGGITQHIGAYQVESNGHPITFLDTPGHAAFTAIRARGARVTDIAVLVVAADDGIMPQTLEAINHAKAAQVPIVVAINKMDLPGADPERVKRQLSEQELLVEDWGGDVISVDVSAKTGAGIDNLLENLLLVAEIGELKANPNKPAQGVVIEAKLDRKRGPSTTVLVQDGTLKIGDFIVAGGAFGRVKVMSNDQGKIASKAVPAIVANHIDNPKIGQLCKRLSRSSSPAVKKLMQAVIESSTNVDAKGQATYALAKAMIGRSGKGSKKAEVLLQSVIDDYNKVDNGSLAKTATRDLFEIQHLSIGCEAPAITQEDIDGVEFSLVDYRGKVVVLDFWGDW